MGLLHAYKLPMALNINDYNGAFSFPINIGLYFYSWYIKKNIIIKKSLLKKNIKKLSKIKIQIF